MLIYKYINILKSYDCDLKITILFVAKDMRH